MLANKTILAIIPARGGSKRLPGKNIKPLRGKPLISYAIEAAKFSRYIDEFIVSTDSERIAEIAKKYGADVPFLRPKKIARDDTPMLSVLQHSLGFLENQGKRFDEIVLIQPTTPGVLSQDIDRAINKLIRSGANSCVSVCEVKDHPELIYQLGRGDLLIPYVPAVRRSQDKTVFYRLNGAVYAVHRDVLMKKERVYDNENCTYIIMPRERSIDIDTDFDFFLAEATLKRMLKSSR